MLQRWDPFSELRRMEENMDRLWRGFGRGELAHDGAETGDWTLPLDVVEEADKITVKASLPGVTPEQIQVSIENGVLTIKGETKSEQEHKEANYLVRERRSGSFYRAIRLPESADADKATSVYEHGVLTVTLPKAEAKKAKQLKVAVAAK